MDEAEPRVERRQFRAQVDDVEVEACAAGPATVVFDDPNQEARQTGALVRRINGQHREVPGAAVDFHMYGRPQPSRRPGRPHYLMNVPSCSSRIA